MLQWDVQRSKLEINRIQMLRFPLQDLRACPGVVRHQILCQNQPIVTMLQFWYDIFEDRAYILYFKDIFHVYVNYWCVLWFLINVS